jgi:hypothetical protein
MKKFLDDAFEHFNKNWSDCRKEVEAAQSDFDKGVDDLLRIFGDDVARKPTSPQFNRAIFDALIFFHSQPRVRKALRPQTVKVKKAYEALFTADSGFLKAVESDTAGAPNTYARLRIWAQSLSTIAGQSFHAPKIPGASDEKAKKRATAAVARR